MKTFFQTESPLSQFKKRLLTILAFCGVSVFSAQFASAQSVLITAPNDPVGPNDKSMLEVRSTDKGMLVPRMTESERLGIDLTNWQAATEDGMLVYQTDEEAGFYYWTEANGWAPIFSGAANLTVDFSQLEPGTEGDMLYYDPDQGWVVLPSPATFNPIDPGNPYAGGLDQAGCEAACLVDFPGGDTPGNPNEALYAACVSSCTNVYWALTLPHAGTGTPTWQPTTAFTVEGDGLGEHTANQRLKMMGNDIAMVGNIDSGSDKRFKKNIEPITDALEMVLKLNGVTYDWRQDEFPNMGFNDLRQVGLIAQELEEVFPHVVRTNEEGYKSVTYANMVALLIEAIKDQQKIIDGQQEEITALKAMQDEVVKLKASVELLSEHIGTTSK